MVLMGLIFTLKKVGQGIVFVNNKIATFGDWMYDKTGRGQNLDELLKAIENAKLKKKNK